MVISSRNAFGVGFFGSVNGNYPLASVLNRAPLASDDSSKGYAVGNRWLYNGNLYQATSITSGSAVWATVSTGSSLLGDTVTGAKGLWGLTKLRSGYSGMCFKAYRVSDASTLDIGFVGNEPDWASYDTFVASTNGYVTTLYDQSGNTLNLTQATAASMPRIVPFSIGSRRVMTFDGENGARFLVNAAFTVSSLKNYTLCSIGRWTNDKQSGVDLELGTNPDHTYYSFSDGSGNQALRMYYNGNQNIPANTAQYLDDQIRVIKNTAGQPIMQQNNKRYQYPNITDQTVGTTSIRFGNSVIDPTGLAARDQILAWAFYDSALSQANEDLFRDRAYVYTGIQPQRTSVIAGDGDSLWQDIGASYMEYGDQQVLRRTLTKPAYIVGGGYQGRLASLVATYATDQATRCKGPGINVAIITAGSNDIANGSTASSVYTSLQSISTAYRAQGYKVVMNTILPRPSSAGFEAVRQTLNTMILAGNGTDFDGVSDIGGSATIGNPANIGIYYIGDQTHLNDAGYAIKASIERPVIEQFL